MRDRNMLSKIEHEAYWDGVTVGAMAGVTIGFIVTAIVWVLSI
jgi:ElaB/YqjD/DUF883 family membrane-anchored ribosome-binding protein